jgi:hypothetical protein
MGVVGKENDLCVAGDAGQGLEAESRTVVVEVDKQVVED